MYEDQIPTWIHTTLRERGWSIDNRAAQLLAEYLGADLSKLGHELEKLIIGQPGGGNGTTISVEQVENQVGVSKEFNNFELINAILARNVVKANQIVNYFERNPKKNPLVLTLTLLFNTFSQLVIAYSIPNRSQDAVMQHLELKGPYQARSVMQGLANYTPHKAVQTISLLRHYDARSKGMMGNSATDAELLRELIFKIMH